MTMDKKETMTKTDNKIILTVLMKIIINSQDKTIVTITKKKKKNILESCLLTLKHTVLGVLVT